MADKRAGMLTPRAITDLDEPYVPSGGMLKPRRMTLAEILAERLGRMTGDTRASHQFAGRVADVADAASAYIPSMMYGGAQDIAEGSEREDGMQRARGAVGMLAPLAALVNVPAKVAKGMLAATGAGLGGAAAYDMLGPEAADAASLTRKQQRAVEMENQKALGAAEAERVRAMGAAEAEARKAEDAARIEREAKDAEAKAQLGREQAARDVQANMPFHEKFPTLNEFLPFAAYGLPMAGGALTRFGVNRVKNAETAHFNSAISRAEAARLSKDPEEKLLSALELNAHLKPGTKKGMLNAVEELSPLAVGAGVGAELNMLPTQYNAKLPEGNPEGEAARERVFNPGYILSQGGQAAIGALGGLTGSHLWGKAFPAKVRDTPRATALKGILDSQENLQNPRNAKGQFISRKP